MNKRYRIETRIAFYCTAKSKKEAKKKLQNFVVQASSTPEVFSKAGTYMTSFETIKDYTEVEELAF